MSRRNRLPLLTAILLALTLGPIGPAIGAPAPEADAAASAKETAAPATDAPAPADTDARIRQLEQEVSVLKQQVAILSKALAELRTHLNIASDAPPPAVTDPAAPRPIVSDKPLRPIDPDALAPIAPSPAPTTANATAIDLPTPQAPPAAAPGGPAEAGPTTYTSVQQIIAALPQGIQPDAQTGWEPAVAENARQWLAKHMAGAPVKIRASLAARTIGGIVRPDPADPQQAKGGATRYQVNLVLSPERFRYRDMLCEGRIVGDDGQTVSITVDDAFARRAANLLRPGQAINLQGRIKSVTLAEASAVRTVIIVKVADYSVFNYRK